MRNPIKSNQNIYGNYPTNGEYRGSIFFSKDRKIGSTFLIHPNWI
jgi:hypothetical protein